jgi:glycosyltransferase involved in cell wall biosynthesis
MGWGGQEIRIVQESAGMLKRGHRIVIAATVGSNILQRAGDEGLETVSTDFQKRNPFSPFRIAALIDKIRPDVLNTHSSSDSWVASIGAKLSKIKPKIIRTRHLSTPISRSFPSRVIYDLLPDAVMTTGEEIRQRMIHVNGFRDSRIYSIPTGIDICRFNPDKVKPAFKPDNFAVGMVGVLRSWKGHVFLLKAIPDIVKQIPEVHFYIVGEGPQRENIERIAKEMSLQDRISLLGHREDIPEIMASLDVIVHPSYAGEGIPQSLLQALAMKRPVIASDAGAIKEIIRDNTTGFLIEPENPHQIAEKVIAIYQRPDLRKVFGDNGRRLVEEEHSIEQMLDKIEALYHRMFNNE